MDIPRSVGETLASRMTITEEGSAAIGRRHVGVVQIPLLNLPWREDERKKDG